MKVKFFYSSLILVILLLTSLFGSLAFNVLNKYDTLLSSHNHDSHSNTGVEPVINTDGSIILPPFNYESASMKNFGFDYVISGTVLEVKDTSEGKEIVLENQNPKIPRLLIGPDTEILIGYSYNQRTGSATVQDLKPSTKANFLVMYFFKSKEWILKYIFIEPIN